MEGSPARVPPVWTIGRRGFRTGRRPRLSRMTASCGSRFPSRCRIIPSNLDPATDSHCLEVGILKILDYSSRQPKAARTCRWEGIAGHWRGDGAGVGNWGIGREPFVGYAEGPSGYSGDCGLLITIMQRGLTCRRDSNVGDCWYQLCWGSNDYINMWG
jgi:hypothetical protein